MAGRAAAAVVARRYDRARDSASRIGHSSDKVIAVKRIFWGAIIAGSLIALAVWIMLTLLGLGLGIAQPTQGSTALNTGMSIAGLVWWIVSGLIAVGVGGYVAARMAGVTKAMDGVLQGVTTWALTSLVMIYLLTTVVGVIGGAFAMLLLGLGAGGGAAGKRPPREHT